MDLALDDRTPASAKAIEARWWALPGAIKEKRAQLEARKDMLHAACEALRSRSLALRETLAQKQQRLRDAIANAAPAQTVGVAGFESWRGGRGAGTITIGGGPGPERQQEIDRLAEDRARVEALAKDAQRRWEVAARVHQNAAEWLEATAVAAIVPVVVPYERVADPRGEVETIRTKLAALDREAETIARAPVPTSEALQRLDALARDVVARRATRLSERARPFFSRHGVRSVEALFGLVQGFAESPRELADAIRERCEADFLAEQKAWKEAVRAQGVNGEAVSSSDRPERLAAIARQRHELAQREETIVLAAERDGLELDRRADADPAIVLTTTLADAA